VYCTAYRGRGQHVVRAEANIVEQREVWVGCTLSKHTLLVALMPPNEEIYGTFRKATLFGVGYGRVVGMPRMAHPGTYPRAAGQTIAAAASAIPASVNLTDEFVCFGSPIMPLVYSRSSAAHATLGQACYGPGWCRIGYKSASLPRPRCAGARVRCSSLDAPRTGWFLGVAGMRRTAVLYL
jgi:hypothetical protein